MCPKIMLVQDDMDLYDQLKPVLASADYELVWANGDGSALELFELSEFQVLVLDLDLRNGKAWNTLADLVTLDPLVRMILVSSSPGWRSLGESVGADAVLDKPLDVPALGRKIAALCTDFPHRNRLHVVSQDLNERRLADTNLFYLQWLNERRHAVCQDPSLTVVDPFRA
jgi:DNA-binding response OmpR family regulator